MVQCCGLWLPSCVHLLGEGGSCCGAWTVAGRENLGALLALLSSVPAPAPAPACCPVPVSPQLSLSVLPPRPRACAVRVPLYPFATPLRDYSEMARRYTHMHVCPNLVKVVLHWSQVGCVWVCGGVLGSSPFAVGTAKTTMSCVAVLGSVLPRVFTL
jgi:hypothetical protein